MRLGVQAALVRGELVRGDVDIEDGRVAAIGLAPVMNGRIAVPGFVDLQVNGFGGVDFLAASREDYARAGEARSSRRSARSRSTVRARAYSVPTSRGRSSPRSGSARIPRSTVAIPIRPSSIACSTPAR
jgi:hypothetical protein